MKYREALRLRERMREASATRATLIAAIVAGPAAQRAEARLLLSAAQADYAAMLLRSRELIEEDSNLTFILDVPEPEVLTLLATHYGRQAERNARTEA